MKILPYKLGTTNDKLTSRAGLLAVAQLMETLQLSERADQLFPPPGSNRGFKPSVYFQTFMMMHHEGSFHLEEVRHLQDDDALREVLDLGVIPQAKALGDWLRRMGGEATNFSALRELNKIPLASALHNLQGVTLDVDATEIIASKSDAQWTYKKNRGYMPIVGHIAETGQIVACDFRAGNASPSRENLEFIQQCREALPKGCFIQSLRIDSAGYQEKIIRYCDQQNIRYAIRAKMSPSIKAYIDELPEERWQPLLNRKGKVIDDQSVCRTTHCISDYEQAFTLVIQRTRVKGQTQLDLTTDQAVEEVIAGEYVYRAIATNQDDWNDSDLVHWYNQRGEDSENRIKELKLDFGGDTLPCSDFNANAFYFSLAALSYNLFALMRQLLPESLSRHRATTIRWRVYGIAAKVVKTGRQLFVKLQEKHHQLLSDILLSLRGVNPPPL